MHYWLVLLALLLVGCSDRDEGIQPPDLTTLERQDAGRASPVHECIESTDILTDIYHCGECDNRCSTADADSCVNGECRCGAEAPCGEGSDCRFSRCVEVDPEGMVCEFDEVCGGGFACIEGRCSRVNCVPEECDGFDNDCDGLVDGTEEGPLARWCYSGPERPGEILPPCKSGAQICAFGEWGECLGEVPPYNEVGTLACDGRDNNCDGCVDGTLVDGECVPLTTSGYDVVFLMDTSGSMSAEFSLVVESMRVFASEFSSAGFRFAAVVVPEEDSPPTAGVSSDFVGYSEFLDVLDGLSGSGGGSEPSWDAIYETATNEYGLSFREDSIRVIILFTDEGAQSYRVLRGLGAVGETEMCDSIERGEVLAVVTQTYHFEDYDECAELFDLYAATSASEMATTLSTIISDPCGI